GLAVGFLLMALGLVAMLHTQRNLLRLQIRQVHAAPVFAGNQACLAIELVNNTRLDRYAIRVAGENAQAQTLAIAAGARQQAQLHLPTRQRGYMPCPRLRCASVYPLGLFRAWSWLRPDTQILVYPQPAGTAPLPQGGVTAAQGAGATTMGSDEFMGHRAYVAGDSPRLVDWKASARTDTLLISQYSDPGTQQLWLDEALLSHLDQDARIAQLSRWVLAAEQAGLLYGLRLLRAAPAPTSRLGHGAAHRHACLKALALYR